MPFSDPERERADARERQRRHRENMSQTRSRPSRPLVPPHDGPPAHLHSLADCAVAACALFAEAREADAGGRERIRLQLSIVGQQVRALAEHLERLDLAEKMDELRGMLEEEQAERQQRGRFGAA